jgi:hypothetical protein
MKDPLLDFLKASLQTSSVDTNYLLFLRIPKNASSSIVRHLGNRNIVKKYEEKLEKSVDNNIYKNFFDPTHARPHELLKVISPLELDCFSFAVCRNPWDRVVSMYHFGRKLGLGNVFNLSNKLSFGEFCATLKNREHDRSFLPAFKQIEWVNGGVEVNEVLRFENLRRDFSDMIRNYNIKNINCDLPHDNSTDHTPYKDYYNQETADMIHSIFEEDCDRFKYTF